MLCLAYVAFAEDEAPLKRVGIHGRRPGGRGRPTSATTTTTAVPEFDEVCLYITSGNCSIEYNTELNIIVLRLNYLGRSIR